MKNLLSVIITLGLFAPAFAQACPDFSGVFQVVDGDPGAPTLTTSQLNCQWVKFLYLFPNGEQMGKTYPMDNIRRQTFEDKDLIVYETAGMSGNELLNKVEDYEKATGLTDTVVVHFGLDATNDLTEVDYYYGTNGTLSKVTHAFTRK